MGKYLGCGSYHKYYKYIFFTTLFVSITHILFGYGYCSGFEPFKLPNTDTQLILSHHVIIHNIYRHMGLIIISFLLYKYEIYISKNEVKGEEDKYFGLILINDKKEKDSTKISFFKIIFIMIIYSIQDNMTIVYYYSELKSLDIFWMFELVILSYFNYLLLKFKFYGHHKLAIYLIVFISLSCKLISFILSFFTEEDPIYKHIIILIPIGIIAFLIIIVFRSYAISEIKIFMDLRCIPITKLLFIYGIIGIIINLIISIITTFVNCKPIENFNINLCNVYNNNKKYLEHYYIYFKTLSNSPHKEKIIELIVSFIGALTYFLYLYFYILIIEFLTPVHIIFTYLIYSFIMRTISSIFNSTTNNTPTKDIQNNSLIIIKYSLDTLSGFVVWVGIMIYLEIIELKLCNLNYNLRSSIIRRSIIDSNNNNSINEEIDYFNIEEDKKEYLTFQ